MVKSERQLQLLKTIDELLKPVSEIRNLDSRLIYKWMENETLNLDKGYRSVGRFVVSLFTNSPKMSDIYMDNLLRVLSELENSVVQKYSRTSANDRVKVQGGLSKDLKVEVVNLMIANEESAKAQENAKQDNFPKAIELMESCFKYMMEYGISTSILYRIYANLGVYYLVYAQGLSWEVVSMKDRESLRFFEIAELLMDKKILEKGFSCLGIAKTLNPAYTFPDIFLEGYIKREIDSLVSQKDKKEYLTMIDIQKLMFFPGSQFKNMAQWKRVLGNESSFLYYKWFLRLGLDFGTDEVPVLEINGVKVD